MRLREAFWLPAVLLAGWEILCRFGEIPAFLLPAPSQVAAALVLNAPLLFRHTLVTLEEILLGITGAVVVAFLLALTLFSRPGLRKALAPLLAASQALPIFALAPILVFWLGYGLASKVLVAGLVIFFPITIALLDGLRSCDHDLEDLFRLWGASFRARLRFLLLPHALPWFLSGLKVGVTISTIGAVIGEWVGAQAGLGFLILQSNARLRTDVVFAAVVVLTGLGLGFWFGIEALEKKLLAWRDEPRQYVPVAHQRRVSH